MPDNPYRELSHDEKKAADAAFGGRPFNPAWSASAKKVYEGIVGALPPSDPGVDELSTPDAPAVDVPLAITEQTEAGTSDNRSGNDTLLEKREQAIQAGFLIDVTDDAKKLGLTFPVTITKPLWEVGIAPQALSDAEKSDRLRDVLMAFRLRLAGQASVSPLIDFPAILSLPPGSVPQTVPLFALVQPDEQNRTVVTLLLPNEISTTIIPRS